MKKLEKKWSEASKQRLSDEDSYKKSNRNEDSNNKSITKKDSMLGSMYAE